MASVYKRKGKRSKGPYYASYFDHHGKRQAKSTGTTDLATAQQIARKWEADAAKRRAGLIDVAAENFAKHGNRPLTSHIDEYSAALRSRGRTPRHIADTIGYLNRFVADQELVLLTDLTATAAERFAAKLTDENKSARTIKAALGAVHAFCRWLVAQGKLSADPMATVRKPNPAKDPRHRRRMLLPTEWPYLLAATLAAARRGMSGFERAVLYRLAIVTGLRAGELRSLTRSHLVLDSTHPYVFAEAEDTKNAKPARQYIDPTLTAELRDLVATKTPGAPLFSMPDRTKLPKMLRADLEAARDAWLQEAKSNVDEKCRREKSDFLLAKNHEGKTLDFHSLRHTCGAWAVLNGAHIKAVQQLMRHSTIQLTLDTYGHMLPGQDVETAQLIGGMFDGGEGTNSEPQTLALTGTDDRPQNGGVKRMCKQSVRETGQKNGLDVVAGDHGLRNNEGPANDSEPGDDEQKALENKAETTVLPLKTLRRNRAEGTGLEPATPCGAPEFQSGDIALKQPENDTFAETAAHVTAVGTRRVATDCDVLEVLELWPRLPQSTRAGLLATMRSILPGSDSRPTEANSELRVQLSPDELAQLVVSIALGGQSIVVAADPAEADETASQTLYSVTRAPRN